MEFYCNKHKIEYKDWGCLVCNEEKKIDDIMLALLSLEYLINEQIKQNDMKLKTYAKTLRDLIDKYETE